MVKWLKAKLYDRKEPAFPLALFRMGFSLLFILEVLQMMYFRDLIFQQDSLAAEAPAFLSVLFALWLIALVLLLIGALTRPAAIVNYAISVYMLGFVTVNEANNWQVDSLFLTGAFLIMFMPVSACISVESLMERRRQARVRVRKLPRPQARFIHTSLLILLIGLFYLDSMLYKLSSSMYLTGLGLWAPASLPFTTYYDVSWLIDHHWLVLILGYSLLVYELLYVFLVWFKPLRVWLSIGGVLLHAGVLVVFPIPVMSLLVTVIHLAVIPESAYRKLYDRLLAAKRKHLTVYYDRLCPLCRQTVGILSALDICKAIEWKALQDFAAEEKLLSGIPEADLLHDIYAVEKGTKLHKGVDTYAAILRSMGWTFPAGLLLGLPPVHGIAARIYGAVAARRKLEGGCTDSTCGIGIAAPPEQAASVLAGKIWPAGTFLLLWGISFIVLSFGTPFYGKYITGEDSRTTAALRDTAAVYKRITYPVLGWSNHGVYTESHFEDYRFQTRLVYVNGDAVTALPIMDGSGFSRAYMVGRQWDHWAYATAHPGLPFEQASRSMLDYAAFWAERSGVDLAFGNGRIEIQRKPLEVSMDEFRPGLLKANMAQPWTRVGEITASGGELQIVMDAEEAGEAQATWREAVEGAG
ncbi:DCC1-like thiol-disulfide oxidoreductase family protein [Paenibacillus tengchongensis]|uniref:DCC1-like thiol-disulfide oxidoreductase family protein n=1 Tax=Paenibacillus tengchongensis TaxID=2608684 RepID=UPI00124D200C|nr:DCC1-like thiol-disulfide oxidoreductase family protein [Paenibacillus tengchongensis]